jgi:hypothetical protein
MNPDLSHWGEQIVVELDLEYDDDNHAWVDPSNPNSEPFRGPSFNWVPVYNIISPSLALIDAELL